MAHCEFCTSQHQAEFWRGHYFYAIDASSNDFPGFIRIVAVDHVAEMSALYLQFALIYGIFLKPQKKQCATRSPLTR